MEREKVELEFLFRASPNILYKFLTTPDCLIRWFCDEVDITGDTYSFFWSGAEEVATLVDDIEEQRLRFKWEDADKEEYWEFNISRSAVTGETILEVTDFADEDEIEDQKQLWESQIKTLKQAMGG